MEIKLILTLEKNYEFIRVLGMYVLDDVLLTVSNGLTMLRNY
jgi:hypothetical protein